MKQKLLLVSALFFGVLAFILTYYQLKLEREKILGAARDVMLIKLKTSKMEGEQIGRADIEPYQTKQFVTSAKHPEVEWKESNDILGRTLDLPVEKNDTLKWFHIRPELSSRGEGLSKIIPKGMRAVSIAVDATSSVTGLVRPNHHIDIIGTFRFPEMKGDKSLDTLTLTILQNVVVLATGTQMANSSGPAGGDKGPKGYSSITLALTPKEVEMIIFASQQGRLTLSLRNYEETKIETNLQSVNFKYLEDNIEKYNLEREQLMRGGVSGGTRTPTGRK